VLERVIENWLDRATERTFEVPFCYMMAAQGHTIIHLTRQTAMELGKDILSIAPDGVPCAFQLKTARNGRLGLSDWRSNVAHQVIDLVGGRLAHTSIPSNSPHHRAFLVTNGELEEEVVRAIKDLNEGWRSQGLAWELRTIVRGEMLQLAKNLGVALWPTEPFDAKQYLDIYFADGRGELPKAELSDLLGQVLLLDEDSKLARADCTRRIASAALLCATATSSYSARANHVAMIEAWTLFIGQVFCFAAKQELDPSAYDAELRIAQGAISSAAEALVAELNERDNLYQGDVTFDAAFLPARMTRVLAFVSAAALSSQPLLSSDSRSAARNAFVRHRRKLLLWGEAAVPEILACFWFWRTLDATLAPEHLLRQVTSAVIRRNQPGSSNALASPYHTFETRMLERLGASADNDEDSFDGHSYSAEGLVYLLARLLWKQTLRVIWPDFTRLHLVKFVPEPASAFWRWHRSGSRGGYELRMPTRTQDWRALRREAASTGSGVYPAAVSDDPSLLLFFVLTCPFRLDADVVRWLDTKLRLGD
jgi:hypothetical protein